jgi:hypothetical protein
MLPTTYILHRHRKFIPNLNKCFDVDNRSFGVWWQKNTKTVRPLNIKNKKLVINLKMNNMYAWFATLTDHKSQ